jgi:hypothetical protein
VSTSQTALEKAFKESGCDTHQWEVFALGWHAAEDVLVPMFHSAMVEAYNKES